MTKESILATIATLANSNGIYSRMYYSLMEAEPNKRDEVLSYWESMNFKDPVDFIIYIEG